MMQDYEVSDSDKVLNDTNIESEIKAFLNKKKYARRSTLIRYLINKHTHKVKQGPDDEEVYESVDLGYSEPTINRRIKNMVRDNEILLLRYKQLSKLYVVNEKENEKGSYLVLKENYDLISDIKEHLENNVFSYLESGNSIEKRAALWEIESYEKRFDLTNKELTKIVKTLAEEANTGDNDLINHFVQVIYNQLVEKKRVLKDKSAFLSTFKLLLDKFSDFNAKTNKIREKILHILSYLGDEIVISQMINDANELANLPDVENSYCSPFAARMIENHRAELFELEIKLANEGKKEAGDFIHKIRNRAKVNMGIKEVYGA